MLTDLLKPELFIPLILFILTWGIGDLWSTYRCLNDSTRKENNPLGNILLKIGGITALVIFKAILITFIIYLVSVDNSAIVSVYILILIGGFITIWNSNPPLIRKYIPDKILVFLGLLEIVKKDT